MSQESATGKCGEEEAAAWERKKAKMHPRPEFDPSLDEKENLASVNSQQVKRLKLDLESTDSDKELICLKERRDAYLEKIAKEDQEKDEEFKEPPVSKPESRKQSLENSSKEEVTKCLFSGSRKRSNQRDSELDSADDFQGEPSEADDSSVSDLEEESFTDLGKDGEEFDMEAYLKFCEEDAKNQKEREEEEDDEESEDCY